MANETENQSDQYKHLNIVDRVADMPGNRRASDVLEVVQAEAIDATFDSDQIPLQTEQQTPVGIEDSGGTQVDPATDTTLSSTLSREIATWSAGTLTVTDDGSLALASTPLDPALNSNGNDELRVSSPSPLDVSGATVTVTDDGSLALASTPLDPALKSNGSDTLQVEQQGVLDVSSRDGRNLGDVDVTALTDAAPTTATASGTGSSNAATLDLGPLRKDCDIFYDTSGAATITIEVSKDGSTWRQFQSISHSSAASDVAQINTAYQHVRAYIDTNLNTLEISGKGV